MKRGTLKSRLAPVALLAGLLLALPGAPLRAAELDAEQQARYQTLINELRCLVCQNQTIADSNAPLAADLRQQVETQIRAGRSDAEIKRYLTDRYGDFVLYRPPFKAKTWLLWGGPFVVLLIALGVALRFVRARRAAPAATAVDAAALRQVLADEAGDDARRPPENRS
ncbi:cytochrome c-type biogenesis protein [Solimonas flava]|uniref:cytochrome c-type biogenesis protein n=1 Tax=Solimonas flava TaxID=415849 RepID=UPI0003FA3C1A|nr:cytochrome c-type biogenesis protein [Solimonas flava]